MKSSSISCLFMLCSLNVSLFCQTVGTVYLEDRADEYFFLFSPVNGTETYLIDVCGYIVNQWSSDYRPGLASYLDEKGNLYRAGRINSDVFRAGGLGGVIEKYSWDGDLEWTYRLADDNYHLHHDFYVLENGNLIVMAWALIPDHELDSLGRSVEDGEFFYAEILKEIDVENEFTCRWTWRALDHIVQDRDVSAPYYGEIVDHPRRLDINLPGSITAQYTDWLHFNSIDVNEEDSLILISCNAIDEIITIEWPETDSLASGDSGGIYGHGGDILFRWGNSGNMGYELGAKNLFKQHDANFVDRANGGFAFSFFNNGRLLQGENYSTVDLLEFGESLDELMDQFWESPIQGMEPTWSYNRFAERQLYSKRMSSAQLIDNNWVICASDDGRIIQLDEAGNRTWEYINPVGPNQIFAQGDQPFANSMFQANAYRQDAFDESVNIEIGSDKIEHDAEIGCDRLMTDIQAPEWNDTALIWSSGQLLFRGSGRFRLEIFSMAGRLMANYGEIENGFCCKLPHMDGQLILAVLTETGKGHRKVYKLVVPEN